MLCWNVYYGDFNRKEIEVFNIFDHWGFYDSCVKARKKYKDDKEGFAKEVKICLHYYFWSKCEWETVLTHWPNGELYELRKEMTIGELRKALGAIGKDYDSRDTFMPKPDREVTIHVFPNYYVKHNKKIDVCEQVMNNWDIFINYLWDNRKELKARK